jgi:outer membrane protein assembly factor BamB
LNFKIYKIVIIFFILLFLGCASSLKFPRMDFKEKDSDWRSFRDDQRNLGARGIDIIPPLKLLWRKKIGPSYSTPLILDQMVIIGTLDRKIIFLKLGSGDKLGSYSLSSPISVTPCADESVLYFAQGVKSSNLSALDLKNGTLVWEKRFEGSNPSPAILKNMLFIGTDNALFCLSKVNGEKIWKYETGEFVNSTPAFSDNALYFGSGDKKIYSLDINSGKLNWSYETLGAIYASPCIEESRSLLVGSTDGYFYALELTQGKPLWKYKTGGSIYSSPTLKEDMVYFGSNDGLLYALSTEDGRLVWNFETDGPIQSSPIIVGDKLFFGSLDGNFYGLNSSNGERVFKYKTDGMIYASPSFSQGKILIASTDGYLYCFGKGGK